MQNFKHMETGHNYSQQINYTNEGKFQKKKGEKQQ